METSECEFYYEPYRRVPMNSATTQKDWNEVNSIGSYSTYSLRSRSNKRPITTTYIDGTTILDQCDRSYNTKDLFPKGKGRQKPLNSSEKKNTRDAYMSLLPTNVKTVRSEKAHSSVSRAAPTQTSILPGLTPKTANILNKRLLRAAVFDNNSETKLYTHCATTYANGAWVRRHKSINESHILNDLLRDPLLQEKILFKKRPYQQIIISSSSSSSSSITSSFNKRRREKC